MKPLAPAPVSRGDAPHVGAVTRANPVRQSSESDAHETAATRRVAVTTLCGAMLATALGLAACAPTPQLVSLREGPREYVAADYDELLRRWTRAERLYSLQGVDDVLSVSSTFEAWEFRWAYVVRYAEDYKLTIGQRKELLDKALADSRAHHQFYVALYGNRPREVDLANGTSAWVVRLIDDKGHVTAPEEIVPIKKPGVLERTYFPYTTVWRLVFRVRFPVFNGTEPTIAPDSESASLRFSGPLGNLDLSWSKAK